MNNIPTYKHLQEKIQFYRKRIRRYKIIEQKFKAIEHLNMLGHWDWEYETGKLSWSDEVFNIFGVNKHKFELSPESIEQFIYPDDLEQYLKEKQKALNSGQKHSVIYRIIKPDGTLSTLLSRFIVARINKKPVRIIGTIQDITQLTQIKEQLIKANNKIIKLEQRNKTILKAIPDLMFIINKKGIFKDYQIAEGAINKMYKKRGEEFLEKNILNYLPEPLASQYYNKILKTIETDKIHYFEYDLQVPAGHSYFEARILPYENEQALLIIRDVTERKKAEQELIKAKEKAEESDRLKLDFLNNMSHEIRTPMNSILGFSELIKNKNLSTEIRNNYIDIIQNSSNQLMCIIDNILEISKLNSQQIEVTIEKVHINDLLNGLLHTFKNKKSDLSLSLKKGRPDNNCIIKTDKIKLHKILTILLDNAFKFTEKGFIEFGYHTKESDLIFFVKDTGIGIKPEKYDYIFQRFTQIDRNISEQDGLGLGLSIARENAKLLNGEITLTSEYKKGTTFFLKIPYTLNN